MTNGIKKGKVCESHQEKGKHCWQARERRQTLAEESRGEEGMAEEGG